MMRDIPVTFNHDHMMVIGRFQLDEDVFAEDVTNCSISWYTDIRDKTLLGLTLIPKPKAVPLTIELDGVRQIIGEAKVSTDGKIEATIDSDVPDKITSMFKINSDHFSIEHTKPQDDIRFKNWLIYWMEENMPWQKVDLVDKLYQDLVAAQYKITKEKT